MERYCRGWSLISRTSRAAIYRTLFDNRQDPRKCGARLDDETRSSTQSQALQKYSARKNDERESGVSIPSKAEATGIVPTEAETFRLKLIGDTSNC